jgi:hypothetical protein
LLTAKIKLNPPSLTNCRKWIYENIGSLKLKRFLFKKYVTCLKASFFLSFTATLTETLTRKGGSSVLKDHSYYLCQDPSLFKENGASFIMWQLSLRLLLELAPEMGIS